MLHGGVVKVQNEHDAQTVSNSMAIKYLKLHPTLGPQQNMTPRMSINASSNDDDGDAQVSVDSDHRSQMLDNLSVITLCSRWNCSGELCIRIRCCSR